MRILDLSLGNEITGVIKAAIADASANNDMCQFDFNGVTVVVSGASDPVLIYRDWKRSMDGCLGKNPTIGPYPNQDLSETEKESDAKIRAENDRKRSDRQAEYEKKRTAKTALLQGALSVAGPIELADENLWNEYKEKNVDPYGGQCVRYAEEWARLMQMRIANGETVAQCAEELSHLADDDGITGFMYGAAVSMLSKCWKYGEELRRWHNSETQIGTEGDKANENGGVLNPAIISIG